MLCKNEKSISGWGRYTAFALLALTGLVCLLSLGLHGYFGLNNDNTTLIYQTQRMLAGDELYKDLFEVAPPFIHFLYITPVAITKYTGIPIEYTLDGFVATLIALSLGLSAAVIRRRYDRLGTALILAPAALALFVYSFYAEVYTDREHLVIVLMLPFLFLQAPWFGAASSLPAPLRFFIGIMAGIGSVLKPYYVIIPLFIWAYDVLRRRSVLQLFRAENWGVGVSWIAFAVTIFFLTPYYTLNVLPVALEVYKGSLPEHGNRLRHLRAEYLPYVPWFIAAFSVMALSANFRKNITAILFLLTLVAATGVIYRLNSGWFYTVYPFYAVSFMTLAYTFFLALTTPLPSPRLSPAMQRGILAALAVFALAPLWVEYTGLHLNRIIDKQIARQEKVGRPVNYTVLRPAVRAAFAKYIKPDEGVTLYSTETWGTNLLQISRQIVNDSRFDCLWQLPGLLQAGNADNVHFTRTFFFNALADDLSRKKPAVVFVENSPVRRKLPAGFDIIDYFKQHASFRHEWQHYRLAENVDVCKQANKQVRCAYSIYVRKPEPKPTMFSEGLKKGTLVD